MWEKGTHPVTAEPYEFKKAAHKWCTHAGAKGCAVYNDQRKPFLCRFFHCFWLRGFGTDEQRPDRCKVVTTFDVIDTTFEKQTLILSIQEDREGAAMSQAMTEMYNQIVSTVKEFSLVVVTPADLRKPRLAYNGEKWVPMYPISPDAEPGQPEEAAEIDGQRAEVAALLGRPESILDLNYSAEDVEAAMIMHAALVRAGATHVPENQRQNG